MENFSTDTQIHGYSLRKVLLVAFFISSFFTNAQSTLSTQSKKAAKLYQKSKEEFKARDFNKSIELLDKAIDIDSTFYEAYLSKANMCQAMGQLKKVKLNHEKYVKHCSKPLSMILEKLAFTTFDNGEYNKSENYLTQLFQSKPQRKSDKSLKLLSESLAFAKKQIKNDIQLDIKPLPREINRFALQYLPSLTVDGNTMIYTKRNFVNSGEDIVVSKKVNGKWQLSKSISNNINTKYISEGASTISADGNTMIFTSCQRRDSKGRCDLYISRKEGGKWSRPKNLGSPINTSYWESQPSLSADAKKLFFVSDRTGGYGGLDIWVSENVNGKWQTPKNLGNQINTFKNENTPFIHQNGKTLFFSSNGHVGMGGYDLFKSDKENNSWSLPENLNYPINTHRDEVAMMVASDGKQAYFAQEKQKGSRILESKIVSFQLPENIQTDKVGFLVGKVIDDKTNQPLKAKVQVVDVKTNEILYDKISDSTSGNFIMVLPLGKELAGYVKKKNYLYHNFHFELTPKAIQQTDTTLIRLNQLGIGKRIVLKNIYFKLNSYQLDNKSNSEISNIAQLLKENPTLRIQINGHTDNSGTKQYNQTLSEKRAQSVLNKLVTLGISSSKIKAKGFGASKPLYPNDSEKNKKANRRIEFEVIR